MLFALLVVGCLLLFIGVDAFFLSLLLTVVVRTRLLLLCVVVGVCWWCLLCIVTC